MKYVTKCSELLMMRVILFFLTVKVRFKRITKWWRKEFCRQILCMTRKRIKILKKFRFVHFF